MNYGRLFPPAPADTKEGILKPEVKVNLTVTSLPRCCSFDTILNQVAVQRKRQFVELVLSYWGLKRQSRNNVPLIRRLQANPQPSKAQQHAVSAAGRGDASCWEVDELCKSSAARRTA